MFITESAKPFISIPYVDRRLIGSRFSTCQEKSSPLIVRRTWRAPDLSRYLPSILPAPAGDIVSPPLLHEVVILTTAETRQCPELLIGEPILVIHDPIMISNRIRQSDKVLFAHLPLLSNPSISLHNGP